MLTARGLIISALAAAQLSENSDVYDLSARFAQTWVNLGGSQEIPAAIEDPEKLVLMRQDESGGMLLNSTPIPCGGEYELHVELEIARPEGPSSPIDDFEGIAVWIVGGNETTFEEIAQPYLSNTSDRNLLNYRTDFVGFGTFISMTNREKSKVKPSISVLFNDGTPLYMNEVPTDFGVYYNFLQQSGIKLSFSVKQKHVLTRVLLPQGTWRKISGVAGANETCGFVGLSSSNKRMLATKDKTNTLNKKPSKGAEVVFVTATLITKDPNFADQMFPISEEDDLPQLHEESDKEQPNSDAGAKMLNELAQDVVEEAIGLDKSIPAVGYPHDANPKKKLMDRNFKAAAQEEAVSQAPVSEPVQAPLVDVIERADEIMSSPQEVYDHSKLEVMIASLERHLDILQRNQKQMSSDLRNLTMKINAHHTKLDIMEVKHDKQDGKRKQHLETSMREIRDMLKKFMESKALTMADTHKSVEDLQANAAALESTVRLASAYSTYLAAGLFASFLVFGGVIYKRMKDMEKKHFL